MTLEFRRSAGSVRGVTVGEGNGFMKARRNHDR